MPGISGTFMQPAKNKSIGKVNNSTFAFFMILYPLHHPYNGRKKCKKNLTTRLVCSLMTSMNYREVFILL